MNSPLDTPNTDRRFVLVLGGANMEISGSTTQALVRSDSNPGRIRCAPGGVARGAELSLDVSADLRELTQTQVAMVCA